MIAEQLILCVVAFLGGLVDAAVGGGGLIVVPGLFTTLPATEPAILLGTNKFSSAMGTSVACWRYGIKIKLPWRLLAYLIGCAFIGAFIGAVTADLMPATWMRPLVLGLLIVMLIYTFMKKDLGQVHAPRVLTRQQLSVGLLIAGAIGFYDGFFGPGAGSLLIFLFIRYFQFDFLTASAAAKVVNLSTNLAALCFFIPAQAVWYTVAIPMAGCSILGAIVGTKLAMRGGSSLIRKLFMVLVLIIIVRLVIQVF